MGTAEFKTDLRSLIAEYDEEIAADRLRSAAYQVVDFHGDDNMADEYYHDPNDDEAEDDEDEDDLIASTGDDSAKTPTELRGDDS